MPCTRLGTKRGLLFCRHVRTASSSWLQTERLFLPCKSPSVVTRSEHLTNVFRPSTPAFPNVSNNMPPAEGPIISGTPMTANTNVGMGTDSMTQYKDILAENSSRSSTAPTEITSGSLQSAIRHVSFSPSLEPSRGRQRTLMSSSAYSRSHPPRPPPGYRRPRIQAAPPQYLAQPRSSEFRIQIGNMTELGDHGADVLDEMRRPGGSSSRRSNYHH